MARLSIDRRARSNSRGQILPLFALLLTAMLLMSSLLLDGASALLMRREYQTAADAAALAGVSWPGFQNNGCALSIGQATTLAKASVQANLPKYDPNNVVVTCAAVAPYTDIALQVSLSGTSPGFFSQVAGISTFAVSTSATAINGPITPGHYSVELLDPTGCASASFSGNVSAIFHGALFVNSNCSSTTKGALDSSGGSGSISFVGNAKAIVVGTVTGPKIPSNLVQTGAQQGSDPLSLPEPIFPTTNAPNPTNCPGGDNIYSPGLYPHGIQLGSSERAFLLPGIYYLDNTSAAGGIQVPAHAQLYSVDPGFIHASCVAWTSSSVDATNKANWATNCTAGQCGVLIVNNPVNAKGDINVQAGGATYLRPYVPGVAAYKNVLIWQLKSASYQPDISLQGGSAASLTGGVYAPTATVSMGGGGSSVAGDLTIQFICWDLSLNGNPTFDFVYNSDAFPKTQGYGLVQ
ncbi:MAG TPA: pilus assembly protein TadG-related protein [Candidatus Limnocylindrales bacterium]